jgi:NAD(P)-dependent dehydrogenase (short-subunit alcohol dehydrogenase family)
MASVTRLFLPLLRKAKGRIVNVASIAGRVGLPTQAAYCASKFAVQGYSEVLRKEMLPWGVTVHVIEPGVFSNTGLYGTWKKGFDRNWENLTQEVKDAYVFEE